jgi:hypothetical protein
LGKQGIQLVARVEVIGLARV